MGAGYLFHVLFGGQVLVVLGIEGGLDGSQLALGRTLLDSLKLGEENRVARQVNKRADVEHFQAGASRERGFR